MGAEDIRVELNDVISVLLAERDACEAARTLTDPVVATLVRRGLFRLAVPPSLGGGARDPAEILDIVEVLTAVDVAAAWCVWNTLLPALLGRQLGASARPPRASWTGCRPRASCPPRPR